MHIMSYYLVFAANDTLNKSGAIITSRVFLRLISNHIIMGLVNDIKVHSMTRRYNYYIKMPQQQQSVNDNVQKLLRNK